MKPKSLMLGAVAAVLATAPVATQAIAADRTAAPVSSESEMGGSVIAPLFALIAFAVFIVASAGGDDSPASP
jgi:hypothetical protein